MPYTFEVNDIYIYKQKYKETGVKGTNYVVNGEDYAYFYLDFEKYDVEKSVPSDILNPITSPPLPSRHINSMNGTPPPLPPQHGSK